MSKTRREFLGDVVSSGAGLYAGALVNSRCSPVSQQGGTITCRVVDPQTLKPVCSRIRLLDAKNLETVPRGHPVELSEDAVEGAVGFQSRRYCYVDGEFVVDRTQLPLKYRVLKGFEHVIAEGDPAHTLGVKQLGFSVTRCEFTFGNERFDYNPWVPVLVGVGIAVISSALGVGGGFLLVPFMSIVLGLPMTIVAGTAALAIFISSVTSIGNYVRLGVELDLPLLALMLIGTVAGSVLGPILSKYFREAWFKALLVTILALIGLRYLSAW